MKDKDNWSYDAFEGLNPLEALALINAQIEALIVDVDFWAIVLNSEEYTSE